jgi:hypothetical protein
MMRIVPKISQRRCTGTLHPPSIGTWKFSLRRPYPSVTSRHRITVYEVLEYLASGMSEAEILRDFPDLIRDDIRACLAFAADRERKLVSIPPA